MANTPPRDDADEKVVPFFRDANLPEALLDVSHMPGAKPVTPARSGDAAAGAIDLTGKTKVVMAIGLGATGKTTLLRWACERALERDEGDLALANPRRSLKLSHLRSNKLIFRVRGRWRSGSSEWVLFKSVSLFGRRAVFLSRPHTSDRAARSGGQDWPTATAVGGCLDGREHGASLCEAGPRVERLVTRGSGDGDLPGAADAGAANRAVLPHLSGDYHYFRGRCGLGLAGPLTWEEVGLAAAVRRRRRFGALTSDARLRSEGPLMRMVTQ